MENANVEESNIVEITFWKLRSQFFKSL